MFLGRLFIFSVFYWPISAVPTTTDWLNLAHSLDGRLHRALPFASSCFSTVNGVSSTPNETECAEVQATYTNATVRSEHFSTYMLVSAIGLIDMRAIITNKTTSRNGRCVRRPPSGACWIPPIPATQPPSKIVIAFREACLRITSVFSFSLPGVLY